MNLTEWKQLMNLSGTAINIDDIPSEIDVAPVRHGAWLPCDKKGYILTETALRDGRRWYGYKCSECNNIYHGNAFTKYCPNCGAKMDAEREEYETD